MKLLEMSGLEGHANINIHLINLCLENLNCRYIVTNKGIWRLSKFDQRIHRLQQRDYTKICQKSMNITKGG
jgi:hypothetical protein